MRVEGNTEGKFYADKEMQKEIGEFLLKRLGFNMVEESSEDVDVVRSSMDYYECGGETVFVNTPVEEMRLRAARLLRIARHKEERDEDLREELYEGLKSTGDFKEAAVSEILRLRKELESLGG